MVFFISRPHLLPKTQLPVYALNPLIYRLALKLLVHGKDTAAQGLQQHGSQSEPLQYSFRLEKPPEHEEMSMVPGAFPISAIVQSDMPSQFRGWFLEGDIIFFRTRAPSYLTEAASSRQKEQQFIKECEQLGKLINVRKLTILHDTYRTACRFWWVALAIYVLFTRPGIWKATPSALIQDPIVKRLGITFFSWGQILSTFTSVVKVFAWSLVEIVLVWLVFIFALQNFAAVCALPFEVHAHWFYNRDCSALFRDMIRSWCGRHQNRSWLRAQLERFGVPDVEERLRRIHCCIDNHRDRNCNCPDKSPIVTAWMWLWLLGTTFRSTWCGSLWPCIQALRSFWAFRRQITRTRNMNNGISGGWYRAPNRCRAGPEDSYEGARQVNNTEMEPVIKRTKMLEKGDLVVRLKP